MDWDKNGMVNFKEFLFAFTRWVGIDDIEDEEEENVWIQDIGRFPPCQPPLRVISSYTPETIQIPHKVNNINMQDENIFPAKFVCK